MVTVEPAEKLELITVGVGLGVGEGVGVGVGVGVGLGDWACACGTAATASSKAIGEHSGHRMRPAQACARPRSHLLAKAAMSRA